ncbi:3-hydroxypropionyl-coenzyme A dehydratase [Nymphon striatum]|nr:3-hydroxypropionyl-coenzyme A dehydratase [Nymphon striatum]
MVDLTGKTALITGASRGIGADTARVFAAAGANVVLLARSTRDLEVLAAEIGARAIVCEADVANFDDWQKAVNVALEQTGSSSPCRARLMIDVNKADAIWVIKINRPEKANSLTRQMLDELAVAVEAAAGEAQAIILTGEGKVFSAGADLDAAKEGLAVDPVWERAVASFPGLSIAALNGTLAGGAMGMALACDIRICVPTAKFFYPVMRLGFLPQPSDPVRLRALVGPARAKLILMAGQKIEANEALSWGLVDRIVNQDELLHTAKKFASDVVSAQPVHVAAIKAMIE